MKKITVLLITMALFTCLLCGCSASKQSQAVKIGSLKGPTTIGLLNLMDENEKAGDNAKYDFEMATTADELLPKLISGELDIALIPANVASVLYNKTQGGIKVIDINTLGVLYAVSTDTTISSPADLTGKTVYVTNKGTTPDYVFTSLIEQSGLTGKVNVEYKSEALEVAGLLAQNPGTVGILPQPFVTACCLQNEDMSVVLDLNEEWNKVHAEDKAALVTGVTVVSKEFLDKNEKEVSEFIKKHKESTEKAVSMTEETAKLCVQYGIIEKEPLALKAIPNCNITCICDEDMKQALSGYLEALYEIDPLSIGGSLPGEEFYY